MLQFAESERAAPQRSDYQQTPFVANPVQYLPNRAPLWYPRHPWCDVRHTAAPILDTYTRVPFVPAPTLTHHVAKHKW